MKALRTVVMILVVLGIAACGQVTDTKPKASPELPFETQASTVFENQKLLASDGDEGDFFGDSVSISGDVAIVGAPNPHNYSATGSAHIFRRTSSGWVEEAILLASDGTNYDKFGSSVSINGDVAVIGAWGDDDNGSQSGSAYIYRHTSAGWVEEAKLLASDGGDNFSGGDRFGSSVSINGDVVLVGASFKGSYSGAAYVYRLTSSGWVEEAQLLPSDAGSDYAFGASVSIGGDIAVVGAPGADHTTVFFPGAAYVYRRISGAWVEEAKLLASDGGGYDYFGVSVSISNNLILVGSPRYGRSRSGSAYIYRYASGDWIEDAKLKASDSAAKDYFGRSVSISGDIAVVGASGVDGAEVYSGAAYVYRRTSGAWVEEEKLLASDGYLEDFFGASVSISGNSAIVGAFGNDDDGSRSGSAYIYNLDEPITSPPPAPCGNLYEAARLFSVSWNDEFCTVVPDDCLWNLCDVRPELWIVPQVPCIRCDLILDIPKDLDLSLSFTLPEHAYDLELYEEAIKVELYDLNGKQISHAKLSPVVIDGNEAYGLTLTGYLSEGAYQVQINLDENLAYDLEGSPFAFIFNNVK